MANKNEFEKNMNEIPLFVSSSQLNVLPNTLKAMYVESGSNIE